jgi:biopolymer transport protein ExbD
MARQHHYRRRAEEPAQLDMTTFLNLMVALIPFLLVTAVFSRISIVELNLPSSQAAASIEPVFRLEVIVRKQGLELTNGSALIATIPNLDGEYDLKALSTLVLSLKRDNPDAEQASVLLEPDIEYDYLIRIMDVVRSVELPVPSGDPTAPPAADGPEAGVAKSGDPGAAAPRLTRVALFTEIAVGDAP